jgi:hypothetical protein
MAASFGSFLREGSGPYGGSGFLAPPGFELTDASERGDAILMAWAPNHSPAKAMNQFPARLSHLDTLFRLSIPVQ